MYYASMHPAVKAKWVAALRSGDYKGGKLVLRNGNKFCCLGVLCNLHAIEHPKFAAKQLNPSEYGGESEEPPEVVLTWAGLEETEAGKLMRMNDIEKRGFKAIANWIERNL